MAKCIVILICGIPCSGKSTLSRLLLSNISDDNDVHMISFDDDEVCSSSWSDETFKISRKTSLNRLRMLLGSISNRIVDGNDNIKDNIIIIDDIMYLHSMRRQVLLLLLLLLQPQQQQQQQQQLQLLLLLLLLLLPLLLLQLLLLSSRFM